MQLPDVRINALALGNLSSLPFKQLRAASGAAPATLSARARWLEHGLGPAHALTAAATAALAESVPSALVAPVRCTTASRKDAASPAIWIFGSHADIAQASELLGDAFSAIEDGVWTPTGPRAQTDALFDAISRAIIASLETDGAIRVGADIVDIASNLCYRFKLLLSSGAKPSVIIRVTVHQSDLRPVDDEDHAALLEQDEGSPALPVIVAPLALRATLSRRKIASDALSLGVLARWKEAGLLPAGSRKDSAVVFLKLAQGLDVPFPRACVLTSAKKERIRLEKGTGPSVHSRSSSLNPRRDREVLWRSRKRPRSPSAVVEEREEQRIASSVPPYIRPVVKAERGLVQPNPVLQAASNVSSVLSAASINEALARAGRKDPVPVLNHPLSRTPAAPVPAEQNWSGKGINETSLDKPSNQHVGNTSKLTSSATDPSPRGFGSKISNQSSEIDSMFGIGGGPVDMADVGSLDDELDIDGLFGGGMDTAMMGGGSDQVSSMFDPPESRSGMGVMEGNTNQPRNKSSSQKVSSTATGEKPFGTAQPSSKSSGMGLHGTGAEKPKAQQNELSSAEALHQVLSSLAAIAPSAQTPGPADRDAALKAFYEEDMTKRVAESFNAGLTPLQRLSRRVVCPKDSRYVPNYSRYGSLEGIQKMLRGRRASNSNSNRRQQYVPRRQLKTYTDLVRKNSTVSQIKEAVAKYSKELESSSDEESDDSEEPEQMLSNSNASEKVNNSQNSKDSAPAVVKSEVGASQAGKRVMESMNTMDAVKVAQDVAADCASACIVLIDDYQRLTANLSVASSRNPSLSTSTQSGSSGCASTGNGTPGSHCLDDKQSHGASISHLGLAGNCATATKPQPHPNSYNRSHPAPGTPASIQKSGQKKERDTSALLELLQMQCISVNGLQLFSPSDESNLFSESNTDAAVDKPPKSATALSYKSLNPKPTSSVTLRKVLHGFSRTVECSKALRNYAVNGGTENCSGNVSVSGPLGLNDVYGEGSNIESLETPQVCVGFKKDWMETSGTVLPLWEKSGLEPYSDKKHVMYTILAPKSSEQDAKVFFRDVSAAYEECSLGKHSPLAGDLINCVAVSQSSSKSRKTNEIGDLSPEEAGMIQQFGLAVTSLGNKLTSLRRTMESGNNIVVYVVSPFRRGADSANNALLRTVAPLLHAIPGVVASSIHSSGNPQPVPAWRSPSGPGNGLALHVRVIPCDAIDRRMSKWMNVNAEFGVPPRPQLVKGLAFSVYSSLRSKRVRTFSLGGDKENTSGNVLSPDNHMSPMTPDLVATTPHSPSGSPNGPNVEDGHSQQSSAAQHGTVAIDQSSALWPSFLHEPAFVLAGVGSQLAQTDEAQGSTTIVLHLAYAFCKEASRFVFTWTDSRGELLDTASVPVLGNGAAGSRRQAFWCMWLRGQRWRLPYVESVHITISKLGSMEDGEVDDWDRVTCRILYGSVTAKAEAEERTGVARRFNDMDVLMDHPTPATPATSQLHGTPLNQSRNEASELLAHGIKSVTLCSVLEGAGDRLMVDDLTRQGMTDFMCVAETPVYGERHVQGKALLGSADESGVGVVEIDVVQHYGETTRGKNAAGETGRQWDGDSASEIASTVARNFHALRYLGTPPCWPQERWRSRLPVHLETVRMFGAYVKACCAECR